MPNQHTLQTVTSATGVVVWGENRIGITRAAFVHGYQDKGSSEFTAIQWEQNTSFVNLSQNVGACIELFPWNFSQQNMSLVWWCVLQDRRNVVPSPNFNKFSCSGCLPARTLSVQCVRHLSLWCATCSLSLSEGEERPPRNLLQPKPFYPRCPQRPKPHQPGQFSSSVSILSCSIAVSCLLILARSENSNEIAWNVTKKFDPEGKLCLALKGSNCNDF